MLMDKESNQCFIIEVAIPRMPDLQKKDMEKVEQYQDLRWKLTRLCNTKVPVTLVVIGVLGIVSGKLAMHLQMIGVTTKIELLQKAVLLGTARLPRKVLNP